MSKEEIIGIIDYLNSLSFSEFELETGDLKVRIKREGQVVVQTDAQKETAADAAPQKETEEKPDNRLRVLAPITGVYYQAPGPDEKAYVKVGDTVKEGDVLCILEAMKNMIEVESDKAGQIAEILGVDGESIDEEQPLFIFKGE